MNYISPNFNITGKKKGNSVYLTQEVFHPAYHTRLLPETHRVLAENIPTIFCNECFNDKKLPFENEVKNTEVGHLFEHLIIENLKILSLKKYGVADFMGVTSWDWKKYKKGEFKITISSKELERDMFNEAFKKAVKILENIYKSGEAKKSEKFPSRSLVVN